MAVTFYCCSTTFSLTLVMHQKLRAHFLWFLSMELASYPQYRVLVFMFFLVLSLTQLFICLQHEEGGVQERARDYNAIWMSVVEILDGDIYLGA